MMQRRNRQRKLIQREFAATGEVRGHPLWLIDWRKAGLPYYSIYVIAPVDGWPSKIGISSAPRKRVAEIQTSHWKELKVWGCVWVESKEDALRVERKAHQLLKDDGAFLLGEWFDKRPHKLEQLIEFAANSLDIVANGLPPFELYKDAFHEMVEATG